MNKPVVNRLKTSSSGMPIVDWYLEEEQNDIRLCAEVDGEEYSILTVTDGQLVMHTLDDQMLEALGLAPGSSSESVNGWFLPKMTDDDNERPIGYIPEPEE